MREAERPPVFIYMKNQKSIKEFEFNILNKTCQSCRLCPQVMHDHAFIGPENGSLDADLMFIAEAPGNARDVPLIPLFGNQSGNNFSKLLAHAGISRSKIFVTNALLHSPIRQNGTMRQPRASELKNCSRFLNEQISIVKPQLIVAVGRVAVDQLNKMSGLEMPLDPYWTHFWKIKQCYVTTVYHPSPNVMSSKRAMTDQIADYKRIADMCRLVELDVFDDV